MKKIILPLVLSLLVISCSQRPTAFTANRDWSDPADPARLMPDLPDEAQLLIAAGNAINEMSR